MNSELSWLLKLAGAVLGVAALIDEGRRRGWL